MKFIACTRVYNIDRLFPCKNSTMRKAWSSNVRTAHISENAAWKCCYDNQNTQIEFSSSLWFRSSAINFSIEMCTPGAKQITRKIHERKNKHTSLQTWCDWNHSLSLTLILISTLIALRRRAIMEYYAVDIWLLRTEGKKITFQFVTHSSCNEKRMAWKQLIWNSTPNTIHRQIAPTET